MGVLGKIMYGLLLIVSIGLIVSACTSTQETSDAPEKKEVQKKQAQEGVKTMANTIATVETNVGVFKFELYEQRAPITTKNFIELAGSKFYDGLTFHRYEPGFVIQGGDPEGTGMGGSDKTIPLEIHPELRHVKGAVAMARSQDPNSASSQWYITLEQVDFLDDNYAVFGKVIEGMDVVLKLRAGDKMEKVTLEKQ
jgi:peptidyl-prolyl cis-trans isomerase B (cyclophilin B)